MSGLTVMANCQEVFTSQKALTQLVISTCVMVYSNHYTMPFTDKSPQPIQDLLHPHMQTGLLVTTESQTGNMSTEICDLITEPYLKLS